MKKLLLLLLLVQVITFSSAIAQEEIPFQAGQTQDPGTITRGVIEFPVKAFIYDESLRIDFLYNIGDISIALTNALTGEVLYSCIHNSVQSLGISLMGEEAGVYKIQLTLPNSQIYWGSFVK